MHATHKILARAAGVGQVAPGDVITVKADVAFIQDMYPDVLRFFLRICGEAGVEPHVFDRDRQVIFIDHYAPPPTDAAATDQKKLRDFALEGGITHFYDHEGICHNLLPEKGLVWPGAFIVGGDSHTCTSGAYGALAVTADATEIATVMATGELWFKVPDVMKVNLEGRLPSGVSAKDLALHVAREIGLGGALNNILEYAGPGVGTIGLDGRMTLCNMAWEYGAETGFIAADDLAVDYLRKRCDRALEPPTTDPGYRYSRVLNVSLSRLEPVVAAPHSLVNVQPVRSVEGIRIHQAWIGSCSNGSFDDLAVAAAIMQGRKVARGVKAIIVPTTREVYLRALEAGYIKTFLEAGAALCNPGCGPCVALHMGLLGAGEVCVSASNRNLKGRLGSEEAEIYLASPATIAASAVAGAITDPRRFLNSPA